MFNRPNSQDSVQVVADYIELQCLLKQTPVSSYSLRSLFSMSDDEINYNGVESSDDLSMYAIEDGIKECEHRAMVCPARYPFNVDSNSLELQMTDESNKEIYQFLLLSTRLDMRNQRVQGGYDGTKLFEELCASVAKEYFGHHSKVMVFGTAVEGGFIQKIEDVIKKLNLTSIYKNPLGSSGKQKDAAVDVIVWTPFTDNKDSQMIAIGQCKTGTHWESMLSSTQPNVFFESYFTGKPIADVGRLFFVAESLGIDRWEERCRRAGIMFDRTRIMEFLPTNICPNLLEKIKQWNHVALVCAERNIQ